MLAVLAGLLGSASYASAAPVDGFAGTWVNDNMRSTWSNGQFPKGKMRLKIDVEIHDNHLVYHSINDTAKGKPPMQIAFDAVMDGKSYPVQGTTRYSSVRVRALEGNQLEILEMQGEDVVVGAIWQLQDDGKTLMRWGIGRSPEGKSKAYTEFFSHP
ncbi:hypothetical protein KUA08_05700 [Komagataeibacter melomenusus]|nr:hypothetical protein [Komagataeibacter melomenusus]MBV1830111.1 hypothetical protein [Komagataeibacter melomenusus]